MTRVVLALTTLTLAACRNSVPSLDAEFRDTRSLFLKEQYDLALPKAEQGLLLAQRSGGQSDLWRFRLLNADIAMGQRLATKTLALLDRYGEPPPEAQWAAVRAQLYLLRGRAYSNLKRLPESEDLLARAANAAKQAGAESLSAEVLLRQGYLFVLQSRFDQAWGAFQNVAEIAVRLHDPYLEANATGNKGFNLLTQSRNDEAIPWFERAIVLFTTLDARESVARTQGNLGICYFRLGDYDKARLYYEKAQEAFARTGNLDGQQIWNGNAANLTYEMGDYAAADAAYQRALAIARQIQSPIWIARWLTNLAGTSLELGKWEVAEKYNREALGLMRDLDDKNWEPTALVNAAQIEERQNHLDQARELYQSALAKRPEDLRVPLGAHAGLARTYIQQRRFSEAEKEFQNTIAMIEQRGAKLPKEEYRLSYLSSLIQFYREYVDFLIASGHAEKALELAESSRSRVLDERSGGRAAVERHSAADYRQLARKTQAVLLEYWLGPKQSYLWVIDPDRIVLHLLPSQGTIRPLLESYRGMITSGRNPLETANETGQQLYRMLLSPVAAAGAENQRFIVVPDEELYSFPLESLPDPRDSRQFWIEQATVSVAPSLNYLARTAGIARETPTMDLLAIGDPAGSNPQYPRLEFASQELDSIVSRANADKTVTRRAGSATPESYSKAEPGRFGLIHFAAHAMANPLSPLDSAVILSGSAENNRLLARSVMAIPLSAKLVTLSACRSAGSKTYAGEGPVGFAWAFLRAGSGNVIAGLWDVQDRSTAQLMSTLYQQLASGKQPSEALRNAKLGLIHLGYSKPLYWAPFQLYAGSTL